MVLLYEKFIPNIKMYLVVNSKVNTCISKYLDVIHVILKSVWKRKMVLCLNEQIYNLILYMILNTT